MVVSKFGTININMRQSGPSAFVNAILVKPADWAVTKVSGAFCCQLIFCLLAR
jgi:hypothetical protein